MSTQDLRLEYPPSLVSRPVIQELIRGFDLSVNILQAQITLEEGWIAVRLSGEDAEIERALNWLRAEGLGVRSLD